MGSDFIIDSQNEFYTKKITRSFFEALMKAKLAIATKTRSMWLSRDH